MGIESFDSSKSVFKQDEPPSGDANTQPSDDINTGNEDTVERELTEEEKEKIGYFLERIEPELKSMEESISSDHYGYRGGEPYYSALFNGNPKDPTLFNSYICPSKKDGSLVPLPLFNGDGFQFHFFKKFFSEEENQSFEKIVHEKTFSKARALFDRTNKVAADLIENDDETKKLYINYRYLCDAIYHCFSDDVNFFVINGVRGEGEFKLRGRRGMDKPDSYEFRLGFNEIRGELEERLSVAEAELFKSDPSILEEYKQIIQEIKELVSK